MIGALLASAAAVVAVYAVAAIRAARPAFLRRSAYASPDAADAEMQELALAHPQRCRLEEIGKSGQGRPLRALCIRGDGGGLESLPEEERPRLLVTAHLHGVEFVGAAVARAVAVRLVRGYGRDRVATAVLDRSDVWIVPCLNPDGAHRVWRRGGFCGWKGARATSTGVDPNRNFPSRRAPGARSRRWNAASEKQRSPWYAGPAALSEPESRSLARLARRLRFCGAVHFHSFGASVHVPDLDAEDAVGCDAARHALEVFQGPFQSRQPHHRYRVVRHAPAAQGGRLDAFLLDAFGVPSVTVEVARPRIAALAPGRLGNLFWIANPPDPDHWARNDAPATLYALKLLLERTGGYPCAPLAPQLADEVPA